MRHRANTQLVVTQLWKGTALAGVMYGANVLKLTESEVQVLEVNQTEVGVVDLGANLYACVEPARGDIG